MSDLTMKFAIVGDAYTGKSSILNAYVNEHFDPMISPSIGIDFAVKNIEVKIKSDGLEINNKVKLFIWDTVGQEKFFSITRSYYRGVTGIFLVFSLNDPKTYNNLHRWINDIKNDNENITIFLIGNKSDIRYNLIDDDEVRDFAKKNNLYYFETSAKLNKNINFIFHEMTRIILEKIDRNEINIINNCQTGIKLNKITNYNNDDYQIIKTKQYCCN